MSDLNGATYTSHVQSAQLASGHTYRYIHHPPQPHRHGNEKPTILFLHGFPSSSYDWRYQFEHFASRGYGVLAPDLLGYGGTDKPEDANAYTLKKQTDEVVELLNCAGIGKGGVVSVGHDFHKQLTDTRGSILLSRVVTYYPNLSSKYVFLDIGYSPPPLLLTAKGIDALNAETLATEGYEPSGYWAFFNQTGAGKILNDHQDSFWSVMYTNDDPTYWKTVYGPTGALKAFVEANKRAPTGGFVSVKDNAIHDRIFAADKGGYEPTLNHYRALYRDLNAVDEKVIPTSAANITKPVLLLTATNDPIGTPKRAEQGLRSFAPDLKVQAIDSGHFMMVEQADEVNKAISDFFEG
ncbi:uncharacterized protein KY384_001692 [Bacidia gigantensis]|uniref:uncharacterized protein n=1 Tax=Bacidia gigantensis TaxID=2732470 RepID=UPI001D041C9D|nr:uncharacterized protein KY384_001692 [Bacidia gigantensis]KAG8533950.1 hypothetical protein KY384_001692 [Bacidia gigantensis]